MIIDGRAIPGGSTLASDICIVGGGPAGISLATRLASDPRLTVCLIESGGLEFDEATQELARAEVVGLPAYPLHETRIRALGGSSWSWGGICTPLDEPAFSERASVPQGAWPFPQSTLEPYLEDAFALCEITPEARRDADASSKTRARLSGLADGPAVVTPVYFSPPARFGRSQRARLESAANVTICLRSTAVGLDVDASTGRIATLRVRCLTGHQYQVGSRFYVLAAGGIENARLLLVSNGSHERGLGNDSGHVGRYFMDHPRVKDRYRVRSGDTRLGKLVGGGAAGTLRFLRLSVAPEVQRREGLLTYHANVQFGYAGQRSPQWDAVRRIVIATRPPWNESPYYQDAGGGRIRVRRRDLMTALRRPDRSLLATLGAATEHPALRRFLEIVSTIEQVPDPNNRVEVVAERDVLGTPKVRVHWNTGDAERQTYLRSLELLLDSLEQLEPGIRSANLDGTDPWPSGIVGNWHHLGTTRMHADPKGGVVDPDCRVNGIDNLYVAGGSVFPTSGSTSPTLTIVQLALRLADHLSHRLA